MSPSAIVIQTFPAQKISDDVYSAETMTAGVGAVHFRISKRLT